MPTTQKQSYTVGKHPKNDIECIGRYVDDFHAVVYFEKEEWWIKDLDSQFYTFVNNVKVESPTRISAKDLVRLGTEILHWYEEVHGEPALEDPFYLSDVLEWRGSISRANFWTFCGIYAVIPLLLFFIYSSFFADKGTLMDGIFGVLGGLILIPVVFQLVKLFRK